MPGQRTSQGKSTVSTRKRSKSEAVSGQRIVSGRKRELQSSESRTSLKKQGAGAVGWRSPLVLTIAAAAVAAAGNAVVASMNASSQIDLEQFKADTTLIREMVRTGNGNAASTNLRFVYDAGLLCTEKLHANLGKFLTQRKPGEDPMLPVPNSTRRLISEIEYGSQDGIDVWLAKGAKAADKLGLKTPLGRTLIISEVVRAGQAAVQRIAEITNAAMRGSPASGVDEKQWIRTFLNTLSEEASSHGHFSEFRLRTFRNLMAKDDWSMKSYESPDPDEMPPSP